MDTDKMEIFWDKFKWILNGKRFIGSLNYHLFLYSIMLQKSTYQKIIICYIIYEAVINFEISLAHIFLTSLARF